MMITGDYHDVNFKAGARDGVIVPDGRALVKFVLVGCECAPVEQGRNVFRGGVPHG